jgi:CubicO group peptidase (beta-lactamase class C family)
VIVRHGAIVYEQYFTGADQRWPEQSWGEPLPILQHDAKTKHDIQSATKSVTALLVGIAIDRGLLRSRNTATLDFFPEYADLHSPERDLISVEDLLTMRAGLRWIYHPYLSFWRQIEAAPNPYRSSRLMTSKASFRPCVSANRSTNISSKATITGT